MPLLICLLALLPDFRQSIEWLDFRFSDFLFSYSPYMREIVGQPQVPQHPVLIINKDATFAQRFGRDPDRKDFAELLTVLQSSGVEVVALDLIYDSASTDEADTKFANALASTAFPILAQNFIGRGQQTFEQINLIDSNANRPPWPKSLFSPISRNSAATGLINIASDVDSTVRFLALAYHPTEMEEFALTLGYTTWICSLIADQKKQIISSAAQIPDLPATQLLTEIISKSPFRFNSTGHAGIDQATRRLEAVLIARILKNTRPELAEALAQAAKNLTVSQMSEKSWLEMPSSPLPLIGSYETPCLRMFFSKETPPVKGDGLTARAMGVLLETDADRASPFLDHKLMLNVAAENDNGTFIIDMPQQVIGSAAVHGQALFADLQPASGAEVLFLAIDTGAWHETRTGSDGKFSLFGLPAGDFVLYVTNRTPDGWQKATIRSKASNTDSSLPTLILPLLSGRLSLPAGLADSGKVVIFGEPIPLIKSDETGHTCIDNVPEGFDLVSLDENANISLIDGTIMLANDQPAGEHVAALLPAESQWLLRFYNETIFTQASTSMVIENLPTALDARLAIFSTQSQKSQTTKDLTIMPEATHNLAELPSASRLVSTEVKLRFVSNSNSPVPVKVTLLSETGKKYSFNEKTAVTVEPGRYLVLLQHGDARTFWNENRISASTAFIGTALAEDKDFVVTPINFMDRSSQNLPGVNLHATLFSALKRQSFLRSVFFHSDAMPRAWPVVQFLLLLPVIALLNIIFIRFGAMYGGLFVLVTGAGWLGTATHLFLGQLLLPFFYPLLLLGSFGVVRGYIAWAIARQQEQQTRQTFGRFISAAVVDEILRTPGGLKTGSEKKELSVIFTDLAGFTTISEKLSPEQLTELMNEYLGEMTRILFKFGGTLDKYIGDAIMGFWNHPKTQADHAQRATECAIAMQRRLGELREKWIKQGLPSVDVRAGINSAVCMVGFIGSEIQMNFTCLGDGVNLASRLEGANKAYGTLSMVSESVHRQIDRQLISTRFLDNLAVKGKEKPIEVFEVRGYRRDELPAWLEAEPLYKNAIEQYLARNWDAAVELFENVLRLCPADGPSKIYIERCQQFKKTPPAENWDGSYSLKTK